MPWRDIHLKIEGEVVKSLTGHFFQFWNFVNDEFQQKKSLRSNTFTENSLSFEEGRVRKSKTQDSFRDSEHSLKLDNSCSEDLDRNSTV